MDNYGSVTVDISKNLNKFEESKYDKICLRDKEFNLLAVMQLEDIWENPKKESISFGGDIEHPAIKYINNPEIINKWSNGSSKCYSL